MDLFSTFQLAKTGDKESITILYNKFKHTLCNYGRKLNYETAETDLVIHFLEFIKKTHWENLNSKCDGVITSYTNKFFYNTYLNLLIAKKPNKASVYLDDEKSFIHDVPVYDDKSLVKSVYFSSLTNLQKKIIIYKYIYGYSEQEIAKKLNISRQAVNRAKNRGLKIIKNIYFNS